MSHFTVTVRISAERLVKHDGDYDAALTELLAPYQENNMNDCPKQFMEFSDVEDEYLEEYNNGTDEWIDLGPVNDVSKTGEVVHADAEISNTERIWNGRRLVRGWHAMFRKEGVFGIGSNTHDVPPDRAKIQIPYSKLHASFEEFVASYHGVKERDSEKGRYGYWENPNKKWDWWVVGGRWRGFYPVKTGIEKIVGEPGTLDNDSSGGSDVVRLDQIDMDVVATKEREAFDTFKAKRLRYLAGEKFDVFYGPRSKLLDMGLVRVERDPKAALRPDEVQVGKTWGEENPRIAEETGEGSRANWRDVAKVLTDEQLEKYRCVFNPLRTYAALDERGWYQPGNMGWWASTDHTPDSYMAYAEMFRDAWFPKTEPGDLLVVVDCHI